MNYIYKFYYQIFLKQCRIIIALVIGFTLIQCDNNDDNQELYFIGDSHIARWDLQYYFPYYITHNLGISGSKIDYIESINNKYAGKNLVIITGGNDLGLVKTEYGIENYTERYVKAIKQLNGNKVFIFSLLPNNSLENTWNTNYSELIISLNSSLKKKLQLEVTNIIYIDVYDDLNKDGYLNPEYYSDGLHLSYSGYEILTSKLLEHL